MLIPSYKALNLQALSKMFPQLTLVLCAIHVQHQLVNLLLLQDADILNNRTGQTQNNTPVIRDERN